jgi:hypothetical protein
MGAVEGCPGYSGGAAAAMAIVASPSMSDHQNYVQLLYGNGKLSITVRV